MVREGAISNACDPRSAPYAHLMLIERLFAIPSLPTTLQSQQLVRNLAGPRSAKDRKRRRTTTPSTDVLDAGIRNIAIGIRRRL